MTQSVENPVKWEIKILCQLGERVYGYSEDIFELGYASLDVTK